ncbi:hypothetical protein BC941DRAFT_407445 [Chlamydoabsidia padenii]|nr:hypothetical protein BC941DRAFT_407445 [Chlamydoabsidia padenii]
MMLFQLFSDWKLDRPQSHTQPEPRRNSIHSTSSNDHIIDWHDRKATWSFEKDYVSFPSLDPSPCEQEDMLE